MKAYNDNSLVNLSNSILKHFGAETFHNSIPEIDKLLKGGYSSISLGYKFSPPRIIISLSLPVTL